MSKFCQNCGNRLEDNANICPNCGNLVNQTNPTPVNQYPNYQYNETKEPGKGLSIAGLVLGIIAGVWALLQLMSVSGVKEALADLDYQNISYNTAVTAFAIGFTLFSLVPSLIGLPLSITGFVKKQSGKNIAGMILNGAALVISIIIFIYIKSVA